MDCKEVQDLLIEYIDEPLYIKENLLIQEHLSICEECRQYFIDIQSSFNCMKEMGKLEPPLDLSGKIMEKLKGEQNNINLKKILNIMKMPLEIAAVSLIILAFIYIYFYEKNFNEEREADLKAKIEKTPKVSVLDKKRAISGKGYKEEAAEELLEESQIIKKEQNNADKKRETLAEEEAKASSKLEVESPKKKGIDTRITITEEKKIAPMEKPSSPAKQIYSYEYLSKSDEQSALDKKYKEEAVEGRLQEPQFIKNEKISAKEPKEDSAQRKAEAPPKFEGEALEKKETTKEIAAEEEKNIAPVEESSIKPKPFATEDYISKSEFNIVLYVSDIDFASKEIKNIVKETNSILIKEEILKDKKLFSVSVDAKSFQSIIEKLKKVGEMKNFVFDFSKIKGTLKLNIELILKQ